MKKKEQQQFEYLLMGVLAGAFFAYSIGLLVTAGYDVLRKNFSAEVVFVFFFLLSYLSCYFLVFLLDNLKELQGKPEDDIYKLMRAHFLKTHKYPAIGILIVLGGAFLWALWLQLGVVNWNYFLGNNS